MRCKVCGSIHVIELFRSMNMHGRHLVNKHETFDVLQCLNCDALFLKNIKADAAYYRKYYKLGYYDETGAENKGIIGLILSRLARFSNSRKSKLILSTFGRRKGKISILDIGSGTGSFLSLLDPYVYDKYGVEINREGYKISKRKGLRVRQGDILRMRFGKQKFDVISLWHVLEHIDDPNRLFSLIDKILSKKGVLIFQIPNSDSYGLKFGREYWFHLDSPRHLIHYGEKTIRKLSRQHGFKVVRVVNEFYEFPLDLFWSIRKSRVRFLLYPLYPIAKILSHETLTYVCKRV